MDQRAAGNEAGNYQTQNSGKVGPKRVSVVSQKNLTSTLGLGWTRIVNERALSFALVYVGLVEWIEHFLLTLEVWSLNPTL